jgi:hypothetical protein
MKDNSFASPLFCMLPCHACFGCIELRFNLNGNPHIDLALDHIHPLFQFILRPTLMLHAQGVNSSIQ